MKQFVVSYARYSKLNEGEDLYDDEELEEVNPEDEELNEEDELETVEGEEEEESDEIITETLDSMEAAISRLNRSFVSEINSVNNLNEGSDYNHFDLKVDTIVEMAVRTNDVATLEALNEMLSDTTEYIYEASFKEKVGKFATGAKDKAVSAKNYIAEKLKALAQWFKEGMAKLKAYWNAKISKAKTPTEKKGFKAKMGEAFSKFKTAFDSRKEKIMKGAKNFKFSNLNPFKKKA